MTINHGKRDYVGQDRGLLLAVVFLVLAVCIIIRSFDVGTIEARSDERIEVHANPTPDPIGKILLVHSYHAGYPWVDSITRGVHMALGGRHVELKVFYMDTKHHTDSAWKQRAGRKASEIVEHWQPNVVIAADDNAQQYFARDYVDANRPAIVFCGVNAEPAAYGYPSPNVTGILERPHFTESLRLLGQLLPQARRVAIVTDDSATSTGTVSYMTDPPSPWQIVSCERPHTFAAWQSAVQRAQDRADAIAVYMYHTVKLRGRDQSMEPEDVLAWTLANSQIPIVGFFTFSVDDGALCGHIESGTEHGFKAGQIALEILGGRKPCQIPVVTATEGYSMINEATAHQLGITLPVGVLDTAQLVAGE